MKGFTIEQLDFLFENRVRTREFSKYEFAVGEVAIDASDIVGSETQDGKGMKTSVFASKEAVKKAL